MTHMYMHCVCQWWTRLMWDLVLSDNIIEVEVCISSPKFNLLLKETGF